MLKQMKPYVGQAQLQKHKTLCNHLQKENREITEHFNEQANI